MTLPGDWYWRRYHPEPRKKENPILLPGQNNYVPNYTPAPIIEEEEEQEEEFPLPPAKE